MLPMAEMGKASTADGECRCQLRRRFRQKDSHSNTQKMPSAECQHCRRRTTITTAATAETRKERECHQQKGPILSHSCWPSSSNCSRIWRRTRQSLLLCSLSLLCMLQPARASSSTTRANEIDVDWTLASAGLTQQNSRSPSAPSLLPHQLIWTKYVRLKDVLHFRCPAGLSLAIHLVPAESALLCQLPPEQRDRDRSLIGFCGPDSSDPRLVVRRYSPLPGKPSFKEGQTYFFISTSDGTTEGTGQTSGGLCRSQALRLRIAVLPTTGNLNAGAHSRPADELTDLAQLLFPSAPSSSTSSANSPANIPQLSSWVNGGGAAVFPAILTLEEGNGQRRKVLVHSAQELAEQIESSGGRGHEQQQSSREQQQLREREDTHYELSGSNVVANALGGQTTAKGMTGWRKVPPSTPAEDRRQEHGPKSVRSPEPLVHKMPDRIHYEIGYGESHEQSQTSAAAGERPLPVGNLLLVCIGPSIALLLLAVPVLPFCC